MNDPENCLPPMDRWRIGEEVLQEPKPIKGETGNPQILPLDITIEILSFLPAKSLVRFRRVCKLWHSITHHPHFIEAQLRKTRARPPTLLMFPYYLYIIDPNFTITRLDCCVIRNFIIYATCNGLLCLSHWGTNTTLQVVNPATGDSLTLPPNRTSTPSEWEHLGRPYFGFEPTTKEYKVVRLFTLHMVVPVCQVFTLGTDTSWRQIHASLFPTFYHYGVALKGAIFWRIGNSDDRALRFDLKDECFDPITLPSFEIFYRGRNYNIGRELTELQGSLCLPVFPDAMSGSVITPRMDIWVMTSSSNVKQEWSIKYSIMFPWERYRLPTPLLICNDKILVHDYQHGDRLQYHDLHPDSNGGNNSYKEVYHQVEEMTYRVPFVHRESLVPLPS